MGLFNRSKNGTDEDLTGAYYESGNKSLIGELFDRYMKTVFGVCLFYFRDKDKASDATMQIFEKLIHELRVTRVNNFKGWLSFVVRNHCISELRKENRHRLLPEEYLEFEVTDPDLETEEKIAGINEDQMIEHLKEALPLLKEKQRLCVELFFKKGMSYKEIEEQTKLSNNEVKSYIQNGKRNLKIYIEEKLRTKPLEGSNFSTQRNRGTE
ncbi:MAG: sigma-70 family RNA polymerase sigma factor [Bacteroidia bacterium]|nr:sigma-70 family RNA polymerase sigma factor [Bacteroidia bacterium]